MRGAARGGWTIRQSYEHPDPAHTNGEILADLAGAVDGVELVLGERGVGIGRRALISILRLRT